MLTKLFATLACIVAGCCADRLGVTIEDYTHVYNPGLFEQQPSPPSTPPWTWYINDHTVVFGPDSTWHMFGITHTDPADPSFEDNTAHAVMSAPNMSIATPRPNTKGGKGFNHAPFALGAKPPETQIWAPYIVQFEGLYYMFYCGGGVNDLMYRIALATSPDLWNWTRQEVAFHGGNSGRDPMVLDRGEAFRGRGRFLIYYTGTDADTNQNNVSHVHYMRRSDDLIRWSAPTISFVCDIDGHSWGGPCESPFVVQRGPDSFYLFTGTWHGHYSHTHVFHSTDPTNFGSVMGNTAHQVGNIHSHAAEVVRDPQGKWWVTRCGWGQLGLYVAPLIFTEPEGTGHTWPSIPTHAAPANTTYSSNVKGPWVTTMLPETTRNLGVVNGSDLFATPAGLAIGDALNRTTFLSATQSPGAINDTAGRCDAVIKIITKDGNAGAAAQALASRRYNFNTSFELLPIVVLHERGGFLGANITVNSYEDTTTAPQFLMHIVWSDGERVLRSEATHFPFGEQSVPLRLTMRWGDPHDPNTVRAAVELADANTPPYFPGGSAAPAVVTMRSERMAAWLQRTLRAERRVALGIQRGSALVGDLNCHNNL